MAGLRGIKMREALFHPWRNRRRSSDLYHNGLSTIMQRDPSGPGLKNPFTNATKPPIAGKSQMQVEILHSIFLANCAGVNLYLTLWRK